MSRHTDCLLIVFLMSPRRVVATTFDITPPWGPWPSKTPNNMCSDSARPLTMPTSCSFERHCCEVAYRICNLPHDTAMAQMLENKQLWNTCLILFCLSADDASLCVACILDFEVRNLRSSGTSYHNASILHGITRHSTKFATHYSPRCFFSSIFTTFRGGTPVWTLISETSPGSTSNRLKPSLYLSDGSAREFTNVVVANILPNILIQETYQVSIKRTDLEAQTSIRCLFKFHRTNRLTSLVNLLQRQFNNLAFKKFRQCHSACHIASKISSIQSSSPLRPYLRLPGRFAEGMSTTASSGAFLFLRMAEGINRVNN